MKSIPNSVFLFLKTADSSLFTAALYYYSFLFEELPTLLSRLKSVALGLGIHPKSVTSSDQPKGPLKGLLAKGMLAGNNRNRHYVINRVFPFGDLFIS